MRRLFLLGALLASAAPLAAQGSTFGIRGLGFPTPPYSARSRALGGSFSLFDPQSGMNPAAIATLRTLTANVTALPEWRTVTSPAGTSSVRGMRFPMMGAAGPIPGSRFTIGVSAMTYTIRDYSQDFVDTLTIRGASEVVYDTLAGRGGISDLRLVLGWSPSASVVVGGALHALTGTDRATLARHFADSTQYAAVSEKAELSFGGFGTDLGTIVRVTSRLDAALALRSDTRVTIQRDSTHASYPVDLPYMVAAGLRYRASPSVTVTGQGIFRTWSGANSDLLLQGGTGSRNVWDVSAGVEILRNVDRPFELPIRFGARYTDLPFPFYPGGKPHEWSVAVGTGKLFARGLGGFDAALEHVSRSEAGGFSEKAWLFTLGVTVRPYYQPRPGER